MKKHNGMWTVKSENNCSNEHLKINFSPNPRVDHCIRVSVRVVFFDHHQQIFVGLSYFFFPFECPPPIHSSYFSSFFLSSLIRSPVYLPVHRASTSRSGCHKRWQVESASSSNNLPEGHKCWLPTGKKKATKKRLVCVCAVLYTLIVSIVRYNSRRRLVAPFTKFVGHRGEKGKRTGERIVGNITLPSYRDGRL